MRLCTVDGCNREHDSHGYCKVHIRHIKQWGEIRPLRVFKHNCSIEGCTRKHNSHGYCHTHWEQIRKYGEVREQVITEGCSIPGCMEKHYCKGFCRKHYKKPRKLKVVHKKCRVLWCKNDVAKNGYCSEHSTEPWKKNRELEQVLNDLHIYDDKCYIVLRDYKYNVVGVAIVDEADAELVSMYKWHMLNKYVETSRGPDKCKVKLHKLITGYDHTDHIDNDPLNNTRLNLRECTSQQNSCNIKKSVGKIPYKGVRKYSTPGKYRAVINVNYKSITSKVCNSIEEAALKYNEMALQYHGEFAKLNEIPCQ